jgi:hypothetical protein
MGGLPGIGSFTPASSPHGSTTSLLAIRQYPQSFLHQQPSSALISQASPRAAPVKTKTKPKVTTKKEQTQLFIELVRQYTCLWDQQSAGFKIKQNRTNAWNEICLDCPYQDPKIPAFTPTTAKALYKKLKDTFTKCYAKNQLKKLSGAATSSLHRCKYYEEMSFLRDTAASQPSDDNMSVHPMTKPHYVLPTTDVLPPASPSTLAPKPAPNSPRFGNMPFVSSGLQHQQPGPPSSQSPQPGPSSQSQQPGPSSQSQQPGPSSSHQQSYACDNRQKAKMKRKKKENDDGYDKIISDFATSDDKYLENLKAIKEQESAAMQKEDGMVGFFLSMAADVRKLKPRGQRTVKLRMQQILTEFMDKDHLDNDP